MWRDFYAEFGIGRNDLFKCTERKSDRSFHMRGRSSFSWKILSKSSLKRNLYVADGYKAKGTPGLASQAEKRIKVLIQMLIQMLIPRVRERVQDHGD